MQIVIDIPDAEYQRLIAQDGISHTDAEIVVNAFYSGTPLPKGHGRIADIDKLIDEKCNECGHIRGVSCTIPCYEVRRISSIPTIIEADKEVNK